VVPRLVAGAARRVLGLKPKTEPLGLGCGCTVGNGCGGQWEEVVGWWVSGSGGSGAVRSVARAEVVGLGPKVRNRATGARFQVRHWKWR
jgi:hypothetical protein